MNTFRLLSVSLLLLSPVAAQAKTPPALPVPKTQTQCFAMGYVLRTSDVCSEIFIQAVVNLKNLDDDEQTRNEVENLNSAVPKLRRAEALAYGQMAKMVTGQGTAADALRAWAAQSSLRFSDDLPYSAEEKKLARTDTSSATILAELDELQAAKAAAIAHQSSLAQWIKVTAGRQGVWASEMGAYAADIDAETTNSDRAPLPRGAITQKLLDAAPAGTPADVRANLASLLPTGGNLNFLATVPSSLVPADKLRRVSKTLIAAFNARRLTDVWGKFR